MMPVDPPGFTVVVPTYQRRASLERVLQGLAAQVYPHPLIELLVVCDGCSDGSAEMVRGGRFPFKVHVIEQTNRGPAAARNVGLRQGRGPFVLFLDDDVVPPPCLLAEHASAHGLADDRVVIGPLMPAVEPRRPWIQWESATLLRQYEALESGRWPVTWRQFHTGNASLRLDYFRRAGGFNPEFRRAEDIELGFRLAELGLTFVFHKAAAANHIADRPFRAWLSNAYDYGQADVAMARLGGRQWLLAEVVRELRRRHRYTRWLVGWGLKRRWARWALPPVTRAAARAAFAAGQPARALQAYSGLYNLAYWYGISDGLGGPQATATLLRDAAAEVPVP